MANANSISTKLALNGINKKELIDLCIEFLDISFEELNQLNINQLKSLLSSACSEDQTLIERLQNLSASFKPSFYLMILATGDPKKLEETEMQKKINSRISELNSKLPVSKKSPLTNFELQGFEYHESDKIIEIQLTWSKIHWYWSPSYTLSNIYELQYGLAILDLDARKAIIACHTQKERNIISDIIEGSIDVRFTPQVLTKTILDQIGSFDYVKSAGYFISKDDKDTPTNITYSDEKLALKNTAISEEINPRSLRKYSYYNVPIGDFENQGIGATTDSGKLWITRALDIESIRKYALALLGKIARTIDELANSGEYQKVFATMGVKDLPFLLEINNQKQRNLIIDFANQLTEMLINKIPNKVFSPNFDFITLLSPKYFSYPMLVLIDEDLNILAKYNGQIKFIGVSDNFVIKNIITDETIDLDSITHPTTNNIVKINNIFSQIELIPTFALHQILISIIRHYASQFPTLESVRLLPFYLSSNQLFLDLDRAFGNKSLSDIGTELFTGDIQEFNIFDRTNIRSSEYLSIFQQIRHLKEKCKNESDDNCAICPSLQQNECLRSLVANYLQNPLIFKHKGIELSDIEGRITINNVIKTCWGFAKLVPGKGNLTARNANGAILISQVLSQINKSFDVVMIISPSTMNEDYRDILRMICLAFKKQIIFIDQVVIYKMFIHKEEQKEFDRLAR